MLLRTLSIRCFRGIASAHIDFDATTTLCIGENDCGKSSLLEALAMALGGGDPDAPIVFGLPHLHRAGDSADSAVVGPPWIELLFEERRAGEVRASSPLARLLGKVSKEPRTLRLRVEGRWVGDSLQTGFTLAGARGPRVSEDPGLLAELRRSHPLLWIRGGMLAGADLLMPAASSEPGGVPSLAPELGALATELSARYARVVKGESLHMARDVAAGAAAAEALLSAGAGTARSAELAEEAVIAEIVGPRSAPRAAVERRGARLGSAAQRIGVLMLAAALLRSGRGALASGADPIVVVEDPEAHLHPMTLATVWELLQQIGRQKLVTTQSGALLAAAPLASVRRLVRVDGHVRTFALRPGAIGRDALRKFSYHVRFRRGAAMFARAWLLVEGETEFWLMAEIARLMGFDLRQEGVAVVEFAQSGLSPLIKAADALGIGWHVLSDGDRAGDAYARQARSLAHPRPHAAHVSRLPQPDIEHCFFAHGYKPVFVRRAKLAAGGAGVPASRIIRKAIERDSKPAIAFALIEAAGAARSPGVPGPLREAIERVLKLAWDGAVPSPPT